LRRELQNVMWTEESNKPMISVKASLEGELRRFSLERPVAYGQLLEKVSLVFGLKNVALKYLDDEGDYVGLSCDFELEEALRICESPLNAKTANLLRIQVVPLLTKTLAQQDQIQQSEHTVDLRTIDSKSELNEQQTDPKQELKQKVWKERLAIKQEEKRLKQECKLQQKESKKKMKEQFKALKHQVKQDKRSFQQQQVTPKQQLQEQPQEDLQKINEVQQSQLDDPLLEQNEQSSSESENAEELERNDAEAMDKPVLQNNPPQQTVLQLDPLQLQTLIQSGDIRVVKLLRKQMKMEAKAQKRALKEAKKIK